MESSRPESSSKNSRSPRSPEQAITLMVIGLVLLYALWMLRAPSPVSPSLSSSKNIPAIGLPQETIPLVTGEETVIEIFTRAGCSVCHTIPGIPGANGQVGPALVLGTTGAQRLADPSYSGTARTVHEYIVESVVDPAVFVVPGFPERTMPSWYGTKLSALALEKIAVYLESQTGSAQVK